MGATTTTKPATTTSRQVMAKEEKERQALAVVGFLAQAVATGDRAKAQALVSEGGLRQTGCWHRRVIPSPTA